jgi:ubiquinone/menaquinone biosynthesis C-methylase UbiE
MVESKGWNWIIKWVIWLSLPYEDNSIDCILCRNVISYTDTEGIKNIIKELKRVLRKNRRMLCNIRFKRHMGIQVRRLAINWSEHKN